MFFYSSLNCKRGQVSLKISTLCMIVVSSIFFSSCISFKFSCVLCSHETVAQSIASLWNIL